MSKKGAEEVEFTAYVKDGKIGDSIAVLVGRAIRALDGKRVKIVISELKKKRSNPQNRYYWGFVIPPITELLRDFGNDVDADETHEFLKEHVGKLVAVVLDGNGVRHKIVQSSAKQDTAKFEEYLERIRAWAAEYQLIIPLPNEVLQGDYAPAKKDNIKEGEANARRNRV